MATKNLSRTVIEGGRNRYNKFERRYSNRSVRTKARAYTRLLLFDPEQSEGIAPPLRKQVYRLHHDRLGPAQRWLKSYVGREWNQARSEMANRFDLRTIAGQHIVLDHLLPSVRGSGGTRFGCHDFYVDQHGLLARSPRRRYPRRSKRSPEKVWRSARAIRNWVQGRLVGKRGRYWFWFVPTAYIWRTCTYRWCCLDHTVFRGKRQHRENRGFRQSRILTTKEVRYWEQIMPDVQDRLRFSFNTLANSPDQPMPMHAHK